MLQKRNRILLFVLVGITLLSVAPTFAQETGQPESPTLSKIEQDIEKQKQDSNAALTLYKDLLQETRNSNQSTIDGLKRLKDEADGRISQLINLMQWQIGITTLFFAILGYFGFTGLKSLYSALGVLKQAVRRARRSSKVITEARKMNQEAARELETVKTEAIQKLASVHQIENAVNQSASTIENQRQDILTVYAEVQDRSQSLIKALSMLTEAANESAEKKDPSIIKNIMPQVIELLGNDIKDPTSEVIEEGEQMEASILDIDLEHDPESGR